jgi:dolichol-phosphate mannosyltransferase
MSIVALSVVAPCCNEEEVLPEFYRRVTAVCADLGIAYELVLVNDGSRDRTWGMMLQLAARDPHVVCVNLARNHGHQLALTAGLSVCRGERILVIDADLQDPPELLPTMLRRMDEGNDVVYGQRRRRLGESTFKRGTAALFYRLIDRLASVPIPRDTGDFRLMSRRVLDVLLTMPERNRFIRGMVSWIGFPQEPLLYDRDPRFAGETKYPLRKMIKLAVDAVTSFSVKPLAWSGWLGLGVLFWGAVRLLLGLWRGDVAGAVLPAEVAFLGGLQLLMLGIFGGYLGRLVEESKGRPLFVIDRIVRREEQSEPLTAGGRFAGGSRRRPAVPVFDRGEPVGGVAVE